MSFIFSPTRLQATKLRRFITLTSLVFLISSCGFQLRGALNLSQEMSPIYLQKNSLFELGRELKTLLVSNQIQVTEDVKQAKVQLILLREEKSRRVLSVDGSGRAKEYLLSYSVTFSIKSNQSKVISEERSRDDSISHDSISHDSISVARSLLFDPDAVIAVVNESEILYKDMRRDAARLILLKLQASGQSVNSNKPQ
jgi:LPS-assembly lipoprotein